MPTDTSYLYRRTRLRYGTPGAQTTWDTQLSVRPWGRRNPSVGGRLVSAAGVPAAFVIRRDHFLHVPLRFYESEWPDVDAFLAWAQSGESFLWYPDALEPSEFYSCYLEHPAAGVDIEPERDSEYPDLIELTITIRKVSNTVWSKQWRDFTAQPADSGVIGLPIYLLSDGSRGEPATEIAGTYMDIGIRHNQAEGTETVEVWMAVIPDAGDPTWFLAASALVTGSPTQVVRTSAALTAEEDYYVALRYRRGTEYNPGAVFVGGQPASTWPSLSRGTEVTVLDPASLDSAVWSRTAADAERVTLTITPEDSSTDILIWRRAGTSGAWTNIATVSGPHDPEETYADTTIAGETTYQYAISTGGGSLGSPVTVWTGPVGIPPMNFVVPFGAGYQVGFTPTDASYQTELHDTYDDAGGVAAMSLRATSTTGATEVFSGVLSNVPSPELSFFGQLRHKLTSFGVDDFGEFGVEFNVTVPESE